MELDLTPEERGAIDSLVAETERSAKRALRTNRNRIFPIAFVRQFHEGTDAEIAKRRRELGDVFACRKGCTHCCKLPVDVPPFEIFYIAKEIAKWPHEQLHSVVERLRAYERAAARVRNEQHDIPCAFLNDDLCTIYHVRPSVCRKLYSFDVGTCLEKQPLEDTLLYAQAGAVLVGTVQGYEAAKLRGRSFSLGVGVLKALEDPTLEKRWLNGEEVFNARE